MEDFSREAVIAYIQDNPAACGRRDIARAFGLRRSARKALNEMLREIEDDGRVPRGRKRRLSQAAYLPDSAVVEILFKIGEEDRIVGTHDDVVFPRQAEDICKVGSAFSLNLEEIIALEPDLVFLFFPLQIEQLEEAGLKVLLIPTRNNDFEDTANTIRMWGKITGAVDAAEEVAQEFEDEVDELKELIEENIDEGPSVFYSIFEMWAAGPNTLIGEVVDLLRLENIAFDVDGFKQMNTEVLVARNPDIIVTLTQDFFRDNPAFSEINAVKNDMFVNDPGELSISGPRFPKGIEKLAEAIYPELFE